MTTDETGTIEASRTGADRPPDPDSRVMSEQTPRGHADLPLTDRHPASSAMLGFALGLVRPEHPAIVPKQTPPTPEPHPADDTQSSPVVSESHNPIFGLLVRDEHDLAGLVAYGLYKLSKRDWLIAFMQANRREPYAAEIDAFVIGERTERRMAGYRRQAETELQALAGHAGVPVSQPQPAAEMEPPPPAERSKMVAILHQLTRTPLPESNRLEPSPPTSSRAEPVRRMANGRPLPQGEPNLKTLLRYLLILTGLVICLAILVNYAKSTVFVN